MIKLKDLINETSIEKTRRFDQSQVNSIISQIRKISDIPKDGWDIGVGYSEYNFTDNTGGFTFSWQKYRGGIGGVFSLSGTGKPYMWKWSASVQYGSSSFATHSPIYGKREVSIKLDAKEFVDFQSKHLDMLWKQAKPIIIKAQKDTNKWAGLEGQRQRDFYKTHTPD